MNVKARMKKHATLPFVTVLVLVITLSLPQTTPRLVSATTYEVGVKPGNWATYTVLGGWETSNATIPMPQVIKDARLTQWINMSVQSITKKIVTLNRVTQFKNDTQKIVILLGNIETGTGNLNYTIIARDLNPGDNIIAASNVVKIASAETRTYANSERSINYANMSEHTKTGDRWFEWRWDKTTGIMTAMRFIQEDYPEGFSALSSIVITMDKTNIWEGGTNPSPSNPISPLMVELLVAGGTVIAGFALASYAVFRKPKKTRTRRHSTLKYA